MVVVVAEPKPNTKEFVPSKPLGVVRILGPPPVATLIQTLKVRPIGGIEQ